LHNSVLYKIASLFVTLPFTDFSLAVLGTFVSITVTASAIFLLSSQTSLLPSASSFSLIEAIAFASLISSTDP
jgi:phosphate/sulfate permease